MAVFAPTWFFETVEEVTPAFLRENGVRAIILDVDNTLTTHDNPVPKPTVRAWLDAVEEAGIKMVILSNNTPKRVRPFAEILRLPFIADGKKPLKSGVLRALLELGEKKPHVIVIGDQVFTDVLAGKWSGLRTVLVRPIRLESTRFFRFKRVMEKLVLRRFFRRRGESGDWPGKRG